MRTDSIRPDPASLNRQPPHPALELSRFLAGGLLLSMSLVPIACGSVELAELEKDNDVEIVIDSTSRVVVPGRPIKFYVDIVNRSGRTLDVGDLKVELRVSPHAEPETVSLRQTWTYRERRGDARAQFPLIKDGKKLTIPVLPERDSSEFPLEILAPGDYLVSAAINGRHVSRRHYRLEVVRPDLSERFPSRRERSNRSMRLKRHRTVSQESTVRADRRRR